MSYFRFLKKSGGKKLNKGPFNLKNNKHKCFFKGFLGGLGLPGDILSFKPGRSMFLQ